MNAETTNAGGWEASQMRAYLNGDGMALLPEDLKKVVAPVDKLTNNVGETQDVSAATTTSDSLWLFSAAELCGSIDWYSDPSYNAVLNAEGFEYQLFRDMAVDSSNANDILVKNYQNSPLGWWERSPHPNGSGIFLHVSSDGHPSGGDYASGSIGVVPGFCL
nr:DUF6273 domain-containing protein [Adlercreutzia mucosicola]